MRRFYMLNWHCGALLEDASRNLQAALFHIKFDCEAGFIEWQRQNENGADFDKTGGRFSMTMKL